ncbi:hypothetical protein [Kocuria sp.]|uniref:hypothetical protein n=1 Tax=Kocuria sp. TaxID=1871328 RepID=UPI0026DF8552|nr:hypothetical protein [Kocuria sp.]MDO5368456.1 hypothetical protein [Kocuria sp.]
MAEWNGRDWYVACGNERVETSLRREHISRLWEDFIDYGFISGGGGKRYSSAIGRLPIGARIFVHIPKRGYVGVGETLEEALPTDEAFVHVKGGRRSFADLRNEMRAQYIHPHLEGIPNEEVREFVVPVRWLAVHSRDNAFWEKGMYAARTVVTRLKHPETLEKLGHHFSLKA